MRGENGYPHTPDWQPDARIVLDPAAFDALLAELDKPAKVLPAIRDLALRVKARAECPAHVSEPLTWASDGGDDG